MAAAAVDRIRLDKEHADDKSDALKFPAVAPSRHMSREKEPISTATREFNSGYPTATFPLVDRSIDEPRPLKVAVIGGGLAGILAGILLPKKVPNIELTIFEKNQDFVSKSLFTLGLC